MTSQSPSQAPQNVKLAKTDFQLLLEALRSSGHEIIGPQIVDDAIIYAELSKVEQLPIGVIDRQDGGSYRLEQSDRDGWFDYVVGPHSLKNLVFPPVQDLMNLKRTDGKWQMSSPEITPPPTAVIGVRSCDIHGLKIQDRVFLEGPYSDPSYRQRRESLFLIAIQCRRAGETCFCHSMNTGPRTSDGFDLALTEFDDYFVVEIATPRAATIMEEVPTTRCEPEDVNASISLSQSLEAELNSRASSKGGRELDTTGIRDLLMNNLDHPRWADVAERCLSCANCTMVCPTCFCSTVEDVQDLTGDQVTRKRTWASCFTVEHSHMSGGAVRSSTASQYRQWLTHKLATWIDQFDTSGCVGCGRCITWCPVGIDLTDEVAAIRETST